METITLSEYLDATWALMLSEGKGGMSDFHKYRETMIDIVWNGKVFEESAEDKARRAQEAIGQPAPVSAMEEARALHEAALAKVKPPEPEPEPEPEPDPMDELRAMHEAAKQRQAKREE